MTNPGLNEAFPDFRSRTPEFQPAAVLFVVAGGSARENKQKPVMPSLVPGLRSS